MIRPKFVYLEAYRRSMYCIIGGPQSSGTSLLRQILNRHEAIHCFNESHLFNKIELYENWNKNKNKVFSKGLLGLKSTGWRIFTGLNYEQNAFDKEALKASAKESESFESFLDKTYESITAAEVKMDKTPSNLFCAKQFLETMQDSRFIACVRDPYDTISSLLARGVQLLDAVSIVKSSFYELSKLISNLNVISIRYEDLVSKPKEEVKRLMQFLQLNYSDKLLQPHTVKETTKIDGWNYDENEEIGQKSVARFQQETEEQQNSIRQAFNAVIWEKSEKAIRDTIQFFEYSIANDVPTPELLKSLGEQKRKAIWERTRKMHMYTMFNDPIDWAK